MAKTAAQERVPQGRIVQRVGGFFVCVNVDQQAFSGPWKTHKAAELARAGDYVGAHQQEAAWRLEVKQC